REQQERAASVPDDRLVSPSREATPVVSPEGAALPRDDQRRPTLSPRFKTTVYPPRNFPPKTSKNPYFPAAHQLSRVVRLRIPTPPRAPVRTIALAAPVTPKSSVKLPGPA